jgi:NAD kinase
VVCRRRRRVVTVSVNAVKALQRRVRTSHRKGKKKKKENKRKKSLNNDKKTKPKKMIFFFFFFFFSNRSEMKLTSDDVAFVLGRNGTTKRKIARVADCQLELVKKN